MRPNLTGRDRSFSDFAYPAQIGTPTTPPPGRPLAPQSTGSNNPFLANSSSPRRPSTISTGSEYDPGADLSSFDASTTRAMPGYRGALGTILDGWAEEGDNGGVIPKTWQEEQERRMEAERELHRRRERAEQEEMERKLGEEFWRGEEERFGPVVPEKIRPHSTGTGVPISGNGPTMRGGNLDGSFMGTNRTHIVPSSAPVAHNFYSSAAPQPQQDFPLTQEQPKQQPQQLPAEASGAQPLTEQPPVPQVDGNTSTQPDTTSQPPPGRNPTADAYQIKHITWVDPVTSQTRRSPILLQNENGPCPLLALVNALTLSTPADSPTALIEALRVREHVSLGLLLDAVFDGVVTRASTQGVEVDMSDLFAFLMSLSTGMNVNPRFVFPTTPSGEDGPPQLLGSFEQTKEMRLYNSFGVPLYHGWLPAPGERVYKVLQKAAPTYEEVQNLILHEEIILHRISTAPQGSPEGELSGGEGPVIEDAGIIRTWLDESCTQLTNWGLESLTRYWGGNISDGRGAGLGRMGILFRNDHFCTVMKGRIPGREEALLSLVTDMGYGGYEEVVWESLVSVSGEGGDFWTGDYRPVGGGDGGHVPRTGQHVRSLLDVDDDAGWETVGGQRRRGARGVRQQQDQQQRYQQPTQQNQQQHQQQHQQQGTPPQRRSFVDALLGRGGAQQSAQASLWHQPTGPQPRRGSSTTTHPNNNSLPNSQIPAPMLPPRTSSRTENTTPAPPTHGSALDDLSPLREAIPEPQRQEEHSTDYDLALAMQLQEEEDERERQRLERQRRHQSAPAGPPPPTPVTQFAPPPGPPPTQSLHRTPTQPSHRIPPQTQHRMQPEEQPRNMDGSGRDVPPPPYEQHAQDQRPPVSAPYVPHQRQQHPGTSAPELARFNSVSFRPDSGYDPNVTFGNMFGNVQNQNQGGAGSGTTPGSLGRRRSELHRRGQDARGMLNEFINNGGSGAGGGAGVPGGYARAGAGAGPGGPGGGGGGSLKQGKDCVIM